MSFRSNLAAITLISGALVLGAGCGSGSVDEQLSSGSGDQNGTSDGAGSTVPTSDVVDERPAGDPAASRSFDQADVDAVVREVTAQLGGSMELLSGELMTLQGGCAAEPAEQPCNPPPDILSISAYFEDANGAFLRVTVAPSDPVGPEVLGADSETRISTETDERGARIITAVMPRNSVMEIYYLDGVAVSVNSSGLASNRGQGALDPDLVRRIAAASYTSATAQ